MANIEDSAARMIALGGFLRLRRTDRGLKQLELARRVGVSKNTISQIERGRQWPSMQTYLRILDVLRVMDFDPSDQLGTERHYRRLEVVRELGLEGWLLSLTVDEMRYALVRGWEGIELMRELERRGLSHPYKRAHRAPVALDLLAPDEIEERIRAAHAKPRR